MSFKKIDPELARKLQTRRSQVDLEGTAWETSPEDSIADARGEWHFVEDLLSKGVPGPKRRTEPEVLPSSADGPGVTSSTAEAAGADSAERTVAEGSAGQPGQQPAPAAPEPAPDTCKGQVAKDVPSGIRAEPSRPQPGADEVNARGPAPGRDGVSGAVPSASDGAGADAAPTLSEEELAAQKKAALRLQREKERAAFGAACAKRWPVLLLGGGGAASGSPPPGAGSAEGAASAGANPACTTDFELGRDDIRTMHEDVKRTRVGDPAFQSAEAKERLAVLLRKFCIKERLSYTQGLHEVAAVFSFMQGLDLAPENAFDDEAALACFSAFTHRFVPYFHDGRAFVALHVSLLFLRQLILYHHPDLHNSFAEAGISPFAYATPWFITMFSSKTPLSVLLQLWDRYIQRGEAAFLPFVALALLTTEKAVILAAGQCSPEEAQTQVLRLSIRTIDHLQEVWETAEELWKQTPKSFAIRMTRVLRAVEEKRGLPESEEKAWSDIMLQRINKERQFIVLSSEVATAHLTAAAEASPTQEPCLRYLLLDVRTSAEYRESHLPKALHFRPPCLKRLMSEASGSGGLFGMLSTAVGGLMSSGQDDSSSTADIDASLVREVYEALDDALAVRFGDAWLSESAQNHLVIIGGTADAADNASSAPDAGDAGAVAPLYEVLTERLVLPRISVVLGGAAALHREATKLGAQLSAGTATEPAGGDSEPHQPEAEGAAEGGGGKESLLGSAWSSLQAASNDLPAVDSKKLGKFFQSGAEAARRGLADGVTAVRQQAPELAAAVRQRAADGISAVQESRGGGEAEKRG